jgi:hypothetical protein
MKASRPLQAGAFNQISGYPPSYLRRRLFWAVEVFKEKEEGCWLIREA